MDFSSPKHPMGTQTLPGSAHWKIIEVDFFVLEQITLLKHKTIPCEVKHFFFFFLNNVLYVYITIHI